jgi:catalase
VGNADAASLSRSALFSGKTIPVIARFSVGGGSPEVPDAAPAPRGMALKFHTNDPILLFRSPAYAVSFGKRLSGK